MLHGALYFQGPQGAHALLPRDPALADVYLSNAATHGNVFAMAAMAELELQQHHVLQANVWAQIEPAPDCGKPLRYAPLPAQFSRSSPGTHG
ncbi:MAG: hypothetical protein ACYCOY_10200 [Metallibacterium sp.]